MAETADSTSKVKLFDAKHGAPIAETLQALFQPQGYDSQTRTIPVCFYSGATVEREDFWTGERWQLKLSMEPGAARLGRLNTVGVLLTVHDQYGLNSIIGRIVPKSARLEGGKYLALVALSEEPDDQTSVNKIIKGIIPGVSVGVNIFRAKIVEGGGDAGVDLKIAEDWEPFEVSAVPVGADPGAMFMSAQAINHAPKKGETEMSDKTKTQPTETAPAAPAPAELQAQSREQEILEAAILLGFDGKYALECCKLKAVDGSPMPAAAVNKVMIAERHRMDIAKPTNPAHTGTVTMAADEMEKKGRAMVNFVLAKALPDKFKLDKDLGAQEYEQFSFYELARESVRLAGIDVSHRSKGQIVNLALGLKSPQRARGESVFELALQPANDFPGLMGTAANMALNKSYTEKPQNFKQLSRPTTVPDFLPVNDLNISDLGDLQLLNDGGEIKYGTLTESKETWQLFTYAVIHGLTRHAIINDRLSAWLRAFSRAGNAISRLESRVWWNRFMAATVMADGYPIFHANHNNLVGSGSGDAPDQTSLALTWKLITLQTGLPDKLGNKPMLDIIPEFLVVPEALRPDAARLLNQNWIPNETSKVMPDYLKNLTLIAQPRLDAAGATKAWYLGAGPSQADGFVHGYLEGQSGPYIEMRDGYNIDGTEMKLRHDFGVGVDDYRAWAKNYGE